MSDLKIKQHFTARSDDELCVKFDWSQLELIGWAFLTKDPLLRKLILSGQDVHRFVGGMVLNCDPNDIDDKTRKALKARNFLLVYGGSVWELTRTHGMTEEDANRLYETFWDLFPTAKLWQDNVCRSVEASAVSIDELTPLGQRRKEGHYKSITGRQYYFKTYDNSEYQRKKGNMTKFKRPEMVNYPVQGFCTADIHMIAVGNLWRKSLRHRNKFILCNTIHDDVWFLVKKKDLEFSCKFIKSELESVVDILKQRFNIDFDLPLKVECEVGKDFSNMTKYLINDVPIPTIQEEVK